VTARKAFGLLRHDGFLVRVRVRVKVRLRLRLGSISIYFDRVYALVCLDSSPIIPNKYFYVYKMMKHSVKYTLAGA